MSRKVKCPECNTLNFKENTIQIGNRYYCPECAEKRRKEIEKNTDGWNELFNYICDLYDISEPTGMMYGQLKRYRNEPYNYTNKGMLLTLKYYYEVLGNDLKEDVGLGIIEYEYDNAKKHYLDILRVKKSVQDLVVFEEKMQEVKVVSSFWSKKKNKQLSFENIKHEGEEIEINEG